MNIHKAELVISAVSPKQYPASDLPDIAFAGRSNVGKSSFINCVLRRKSLARTSAKPGKTATLNFYNIDDAVFLVDLPGYGYAQVSKTEKERWAKMIDTYLRSRENLRATILLVDARHKPTADDALMLEWIRRRHNFAVVVATKCDKIPKTKLDERLETVYTALALREEDILIPFSAETALGREDALALIEEIAERYGR